MLGSVVTFASGDINSPSFPAHEVVSVMNCPAESLGFHPLNLGAADDPCRVRPSQLVSRIANLKGTQINEEGNTERGVPIMSQKGYMVSKTVEATLIADKKERDGADSDSVIIVQANDDADVHLVTSLSECTKLKDLLKGRKLHAQVIKEGWLDYNVFIGNALITLYAKCGAIEKAEEVLEDLPSPNLVSWNALIAGYAQHNRGEEALDCFEQMQRVGFSPNAVTFACVLKSCGSLGATEKGQDVHKQILEGQHLEKNRFVGNALVDMYARCGAVEKAQKVFDELPFRDIISWNVLITGYVQHGHGEKALNCFTQMRLQGLTPNPVTYVCILKACGSLGALEKGQDLHSQIDELHLMEKNVIVASAVVDMYAKCGALDKAQETFDKLRNQNTVMWNTLIGGYAQHGHGEKALGSFNRMLQEAFEPDAITYACVLKACGSIGAARRGQEIHDQVARCGLVKKDIHVGTALLDMYAKFGDLEKAQEVFDELAVPNLVSWNALLTGYVQQGDGERALSCFNGMQSGGFSPDATSFLGALKASGRIGAANKGQEVHAQILKHGLSEKDAVIGTTLIDMYANCSLLTEAHEVFDKMPPCNVVPWSCLLEGYSQVGNEEVVFELFDQMSRGGVEPNYVTLMIMLNTCSHRGLLDKGQLFFEAINKDYGIVLTIEHFACMIDLLGRAGQLEEASALIEEMPFSPNLALWHTMLSACRIAGNASLARWAFTHAARMGQNDATPFVCMNSIYIAENSYMSYKACVDKIYPKMEKARTCPVKLSIPPAPQEGNGGSSSAR